MRVGTVAWGCARVATMFAGAACLALAASYADEDALTAVAMLGAAVAALSLSVLSPTRPLADAEPGITLMGWAGMHAQPPREAA